MSIARSIAFLIRVNWNHSLLGWFVRKTVGDFKKGLWILPTFVGFVMVSTSIPDPWDVRFPILTSVAKVLLAGIATWCIWAIVDTAQAAKECGAHLPQLDD